MDISQISSCKATHMGCLLLYKPTIVVSVPLTRYAPQNEWQMKKNAVCAKIFQHGMAEVWGYETIMSNI